MSDLNFFDKLREFKILSIGLIYSHTDDLIRFFEEHPLMTIKLSNEALLKVLYIIKKEKEVKNNGI